MRSPKAEEREQAMADLEPRVRQVEEDVAILKGEIKSVLMEVRTSLLSQTNPFSNPVPAAPATPAVQLHVAEPAYQPQAQAPLVHQEPRQQEPRQQQSWHQESQHDERALQNDNHNDFLAAISQPERQFASQQQPVPLSVASRRSWELNTLAMLLAWCQGNMVRLSDKEMSSLLSLARYGGLVDEELAGILLNISGSFDEGKIGRAATVSEYLLALHELHSVIKEEEEPATPRLRRVS